MNRGWGSMGVQSYGYPLVEHMAPPAINRKVHFYDNLGKWFFYLVGNDSKQM